MVVLCPKPDQTTFSPLLENKNLLQESEDRESSKWNKNWLVRNQRKCMFAHLLFATTTCHHFSHLIHWMDDSMNFHHSKPISRTSRENISTKNCPYNWNLFLYKNIHPRYCSGASRQYNFYNFPSEFLDKTKQD